MLTHRLLQASLIFLPWWVFACGAKTLELGYDFPHDEPPAGPPRTADGGIDETVPWAIATHQYGPRALAIDSSRLYWATDGNGPSSYERLVKSCWLADCATTIATVATGQPLVNTIAVDSQAIYWNTVDVGIVSCPLAGCEGSPRVLVNIPNATTIPPAALFAVDDTHLYWLACVAPFDGLSSPCFRTSLSRCSPSDCGPTREGLGEFEGEPRAIAAGPSSVYVVTRDTGGPKGDIFDVPKDKSFAPRMFAAREHMPQAVVANGEGVHWANSYSLGTLATCPRSGCMGEPTVLATRQPMPMQLAVDDRNVYFIDAPSSYEPVATLMKCPLSGCGSAPTVLAKGLHTDGVGLVLDEAHVYWTNSGRWVTLQNAPLGSGYNDGDVSRIGK